MPRTGFQPGADRAETALASVVATSYLPRVSTRRMEKLVAALGISRLSRSQVSRIATDLDALGEAFRTRPLEQGPHTFVAADVLVLKVRQGGRVLNVHALLLATASTLTATRTSSTWWHLE